MMIYKLNLILQLNYLKKIKHYFLTHMKIILKTIMIQMMNLKKYLTIAQNQKMMKTWMI